MKNLLVLILSLSAGLAFSKSLEWQKIDLEKDIRSRYNEIATSVIDPEEFFTQVEVKYNDPGMPDFKDMNEDDFRISDVQFDDSKGDYIAFSKVGLEVPVVGKAFKDNQRKLKEMYRYNESYDLFKNIQSIDVTVSISDAVSKSKRTLVENLLKNVKLSVVNFVPSVTFKSVKIKEIIDLENQPTNNGVGLEEIMEFIGKFGNAIGMILAVAIFGFLAFKLLKMYMEFMEKLAAMSKPEEASKDDEKNQEQMAMQSPNQPDAEESEEDSGFDKFENLVQNNLDQAVIILKKWISRPDENASLALSAISQQLDNTDLDKLFNKVTSSEREDWNLKLKDFLEPDDLIRANKIVSEEVVKELVSGMAIEDFELVDMMLKMNDSMIKEYILTNQNYGHFLSSLINSSVFSRLMNSLDTEQVNQVIGKSFEVDKDMIMSSLVEFKSSLKEFYTRFSPSPFNNKLLQSISTVSVDKEPVLYRYLVENSDLAKVLSVAKKYIPGELVMRLPEETLKRVLKEYPLSNKVNLLSTLKDDDRVYLSDILAVKGTSAREVLEMEIEGLMDDEIKFQKLKNKKAEFWDDFIKFTRSSMTTEHDYQVVEDLVKQWFDELSENNTALAA
jgi:hypothetical protein